MTLGQAYLYGKEQLAKAELTSPAFDALSLLQFCFGFEGRSGLSMRADEEISEQKQREYFSLIEMRKKRPLQYILGRWVFCGMELFVGEGVLIPRDDTEVLVNRAVEYIKDNSFTVYDLCAGSGAVSLGVAKACKTADFKCFELFDEAFYYLERNIEAYSDSRVKAVKADVLTTQNLPQKESADVILSNPPYIPAKDIENLAWEVKCEPNTALNGGEDGLIFYRFFAKHWLDCLKPGGIMAVEVGINQDKTVKELFENAGLENVSIDYDIAGIGRVVWGIKPEME